VAVGAEKAFIAQVDDELLAPGRCRGPAAGRLELQRQQAGFGLDLAAQVPAAVGGGEPGPTVERAAVAVGILAADVVRGRQPPPPVELAIGLGMAEPRHELVVQFSFSQLLVELARS